jgi:actin-related protein 6
VQSELRSLAPWFSKVCVRQPSAPQLHAWRGGSHFAAGDDFAAFAVTKAEYDEQGHRICTERFSDW